MAAAALTITYAREQVVTFTKPFVDLQLGVAIGTPDDSYNPWSFLVPLTNTLWLYIILMTIGVAFVLSITDKLSPYGHHGEFPSIDGRGAFAVVMEKYSPPGKW